MQGYREEQDTVPDLGEGAQAKESSLPVILRIMPVTQSAQKSPI